MIAWFHRRKTDTRGERYASHDEFRELFEAGKAGFFELAYLLTADRSLAQECLVSGLEECQDANSVFREWAQKWARRIIVRTAIRLLWEPTRHEKMVERRSRSADLPTHPVNDSPAVARVLALPDLERVVYVLSVVEQYSTRDIALLLGRAPEEILHARTAAVQQISAAKSKPDPVERQVQGRLAEIRLAF